MYIVSKYNLQNVFEEATDLGQEPMSNIVVFRIWFVRIAEYSKWEICFASAGLLTIITTAFTDGMTSTIYLLVYILLATVVAVLYSKKVYESEKRK